MKQDAKAAPTGSFDPHPRLRPVTGRHNARLKELRIAFRRAQLTPTENARSKASNWLKKRYARPGTWAAFFSVNRPARSPKSFCPRSASAPNVSSCPMRSSIRSSSAKRRRASLPCVKLPSSSAAQLLDRASDGPIVVAAGLQDPGNLGTILRSAEAFGAAGVFLTEGTVSPYNSKVLRGSAGSIFRLPFRSDLVRRTDSAAAPARSPPSGDILAQGNAARRTPIGRCRSPSSSATKAPVCRAKSCIRWMRRW